MLLNVIRSLTGLSDDDAVGYGGAVLVVHRALVRSLVGLGLLPADVDDQSSRSGLHQDFGVFLDIKVGPVSRPREARINEKHKCHSMFKVRSREET